MLNIFTPGADLIKNERKRQIEQEGFTQEHDLVQIQNELSYAAVCYAHPNHCYVKKKDDNPSGFPVVTLEGAAAPQGDGEYLIVPPAFWPWAPSAWKPCPNDRIRELTKAGAIIAAEIDRLRNARLTSLRALAKGLHENELEPFSFERMTPDTVAVTADRRLAWRSDIEWTPGQSQMQLCIDEDLMYDFEADGEEYVFGEIKIIGIIPISLIK